MSGITLQQEVAQKSCSLLVTSPEVQDKCCPHGHRLAIQLCGSEYSLPRRSQRGFIQPVHGIEALHDTDPFHGTISRNHHLQFDAALYPLAHRLPRVSGFHFLQDRRRSQAGRSGGECSRPELRDLVRLVTRRGYWIKWSRLP